MALAISTLLVFGAAVFLVFEIYITIIGHLKGAPFVKSGKKRITTMLELVDIKEGEKIVDLGSGDGTLCIEAAKRGARAAGIEINPFLVALSRWKAARAGVKDRVAITKGNFWNYPLGDTDIVFVYLWPHTLERLEQKFCRELKPGSRVVSNAFPIKGRTPVTEKDHVYLYEIQK